MPGLLCAPTLGGCGPQLPWGVWWEMWAELGVWRGGWTHGGRRLDAEMDMGPGLED